MCKHGNLCAEPNLCANPFIADVTKNNGVALKDKKSAKPPIKRWRALFMPCNLVAMQIDQNYARFARCAGREIRRGDRKLLLLSKILPISEHIIPLFIGLVAGYFGFGWAFFLFAFLYPFISLADPWLWRRVYGDIVKDLGYRVSFLVNLDMLYLFGLGWLVGWILMIAI